MIKSKKTLFFKCISFIIALIFLVSGSVFAQNSSLPQLPTVGALVNISASYVPATALGITVYPDNPWRLDFILDTGDDNLKSAALKSEAQKIINYFFAVLTLPENDLWVNLSPYEGNRVVPEALAVTEMGRDMLAQDYLLKQLTASLLCPEKAIGTQFWQSVYAKLKLKLKNGQLPVDTFNKVWIMPDKAVVCVKGNNVFVGESRLKVLLEEDFLAMKKNSGNIKQNIGSQVMSQEVKAAMREIVIPAIEKEVNTGKNFGQLRQIYYAMILATWYKKHLKASILGQAYVDKNKIKGIDHVEQDVKEKIYNQYVAAFKQGVFNYVKREPDQLGKRIISRRYFSGGVLGVKQRDLVELVDQLPSGFMGRQGLRYQNDHLLQRVAVQAQVINRNSRSGVSRPAAIVPEVMASEAPAASRYPALAKTKAPLLGRRVFFYDSVHYDVQVEIALDEAGQEHYYLSMNCGIPRGDIKIDGDLGSDKAVAENFINGLTPDTAFGLFAARIEPRSANEADEVLQRMLARAGEAAHNGQHLRPYGEALAPFESLIDQELAEGRVYAGHQNDFVAALTALKPLLVDEAEFHAVAKELERLVYEVLRDREYPQVFWKYTIPALAPVIRNPAEIRSLGERAVNENKWRMDTGNLRHDIEQERQGTTAVALTSLNREQFLVRLAGIVPGLQGIESLPGHRVDIQLDKVGGGGTFGNFLVNAFVTGIEIKPGHDSDMAEVVIQFEDRKPLEITLHRRDGVWGVLGNDVPVKIEVLGPNTPVVPLDTTHVSVPALGELLSSLNNDERRGLRKALDAAKVWLEGLNDETRLSNVTLYYFMMYSRFFDQHEAIVKEYLRQAGVSKPADALLFSSDDTLGGLRRWGIESDRFAAGIRNYLGDLDRALGGKPYGGIKFNPATLRLDERGQAFKYDLKNIVAPDVSPGSVKGVNPLILSTTPINDLAHLLDLPSQGKPGNPSLPK